MHNNEEQEAKAKEETNQGVTPKNDVPFTQPPFLSPLPTPHQKPRPPGSALSTHRELSTSGVSVSTVGNVESAMGLEDSDVDVERPSSVPAPASRRSSKSDIASSQGFSVCFTPQPTPADSVTAATSASLDSSPHIKDVAIIIAQSQKTYLEEEATPPPKTNERRQSIRRLSVQMITRPDIHDTTSLPGIKMLPLLNESDYPYEPTEEHPYPPTDFMLWAIASSVLCPLCGPVAVHHAHRARLETEKGEYVMARAYSRKAKIWTVTSALFPFVALAIICWILYYFQVKPSW